MFTSLFSHIYRVHVICELVSPLVCRGPWMSTVVLYCWCHSDSASVLLYFTLDLWPLTYKINRACPLTMAYMSAKLEEKAHTGLFSITFTCLFPYMSIVTFITSILSPKSMSKLINVNCLHFIGCQNYTNVLINRVLYQIQVTALLPFFLSILHLLLQLSKIMLWSTVKLLFAIVMSIIFGPLKTLPRSSKSCDCVTFRVLKYLLSTFLLYTPHCHMILSKQKCCLLSTGVSTESQNLTSVLHLRQDFLATRNMTRIDVGLARSYVKLLLSSWKTYMCNLMAWYINK